MTEDEMVGWHPKLDGHECEQVLGVGDGQGHLACMPMRLQRVGHDCATELNWSLLRILLRHLNISLKLPFSLL